MLETPQERVKLLKAGINNTTIEKLYLIYNNFRFIQIPVLFKPDEMYYTCTYNESQDMDFNVEASTKEEIHCIKPITD
ncbi:Uncharacterised protein [uncultured archaeon]|nr:Uncharacterised protein [uncultured archaeon]